MPDYIPRDKDARYQWGNAFINYFTAHATDLGFDAGTVAYLTSLWTPYTDAYGNLAPLENAYRAGVGVFDTAEAAYTTEVRALVAQIQVNPNITDEQRTAAGLPVRSTTRTAVGVPTTRPVAEVDTSQRLQHTISFRNEGATSKAKPEGVRGCEIWCVIGPAPASVADARYLATDTATPYLATFDAADAGKSVHYFCRWVNTRNQPGPWSETVTATISG